MNCRKVRRNLFGYYRQELSPEETEGIKSHLARCPDCAEEAEEIREINLMLRDGVETFLPSGDFNERLLAKIQTISSTEKVIDKRNWWQKLLLDVFPNLRMRWALAGAVSVLILAVVTTIFTQRRTSFGPESSTQSAKGLKGENLVSEDSSYRKMLEKLIEASSMRNKSFVIDNYTLLPNRGEDGRIKPADINKRFVIERDLYQARGRERGNHYVLPVVSTQPLSEKIDY
jgi:hypothetical protein